MDILLVEVDRLKSELKLFQWLRYLHHCHININARNVFILLFFCSLEFWCRHLVDRLLCVMLDADWCSLENSG